MDIDYNLIIKYLCNTSDELENNNFSNKKNIILKSEHFTNFQNLFTNSYYRYGIDVYNTNRDNISFWSSIIFCIDKDYITKDITELEDTISDLKKNIDTSDEEMLLQNLVDYLKINIFIFDFKDNNIKVCYCDDYLNLWRPNIYLSKSNNFWEPIISNKQKYFSLTSDIDKILKYNILLEEIEYYNDIKVYTINDNINEILKSSNLYEDNIINNNIVNDSEETFISENVIKKNLNMKKLDKMKKDELKILIDELKINCNLNKPKKKDYINLISLSLNLES